MSPRMDWSGLEVNAVVGPDAISRPLPSVTGTHPYTVGGRKTEFDRESDRFGPIFGDAPMSTGTM